MDEKLSEQPLIGINESYSTLLNQKRIFDASINEISQLMENLTYFETSNIILLKSKFENIQKQMSKIIKSINLLKNELSDDNIQMSSKLKSLTDSINGRFQKANLKFQTILINAQKSLDEQISYGSELSTQDLLTQLSSQKEEQTPLNNKEKIERLKRVKKEYQQIYDITNTLNQLSEDIKYTAQKQDKEIDIIDDNLGQIEQNLEKGNEQLKKYKEENMTDSSGYYKYVFGVFVIFVIFAIALYFKIMSSSASASATIDTGAQFEDTIFMNKKYVSNSSIK